MFRSTVESVKSLCNLETGSFAERCSNIALAIPRLPSAFSKSMGFTLCGIVEEPISPFLVFCLKYSIEIYVHISRQKSIKILLILFMQSKQAARLS